MCGRQVPSRSSYSSVSSLVVVLDASFCKNDDDDDDDGIGHDDQGHDEYDYEL